MNISSRPALDLQNGQTCVLSDSSKKASGSLESELVLLHSKLINSLVLIQLDVIVCH